MEFDPTISITILITVVAFVSPIATAIINNHHQTKMKKLEMYADEKRKALSDFIKASENYMYEGEYIAASVTSNFYTAVNNLYIYFDISDYSMFKQLENVFKEQNIFKSNDELVKIVIQLSKQIQKK